MHRSWGFGKITTVDTVFCRFTIDFQNKSGHTMDLGFAAESLKPIPADHILARKASDLQGLRQMAALHHLDLIKLVLQSYGIFAISYVAAWKLRLPHDIAAPACLIGTSNFFELAVAVAISLFGLNSGAALATVVGVLVEVPVMLSLVAFSNRTRRWFPASISSG